MLISSQTPAAISAQRRTLRQVGFSPGARGVAAAATEPLPQRGSVAGALEPAARLVDRVAGPLGGRVERSRRRPRRQAGRSGSARPVARGPGPSIRPGRRCIRGDPGVRGRRVPLRGNTAACPPGFLLRDRVGLRGRSRAARRSASISAARRCSSASSMRGARSMHRRVDASVGLGADELLARIDAEIRIALDSRPGVAAVGLGVPCIVDRDREICVTSNHLPLIDVPLRERVATLTGSADGDRQRRQRCRPRRAAARRRPRRRRTSSCSRSAPGSAAV